MDELIKYRKLFNAESCCDIWVDASIWNDVAHSNDVLIVRLSIRGEISKHEFKIYPNAFFVIKMR